VADCRFCDVGRAHYPFHSETYPTPVQRRVAFASADEIAVAAFLSGRLSFLGIPRTIESVLSLTASASPASIPEVLQLDQSARALAEQVIEQHHPHLIAH